VEVLRELDAPNEGMSLEVCESTVCARMFEQAHWHISGLRGVCVYVRLCVRERAYVRMCMCARE
jgi:hypothetical protein